MPVDLRLNCAAEICCAPTPVTVSTGEGNSLTGETERCPESLRAATEILIDCGVPEDAAPRIAKRMRELDIVMLSVELATAIRNIVFPAETT